MLVAGIRRIGGDVCVIDVPRPRPLADDEVLIEVRAAGGGNWDEGARTGGGDLGSRPPAGVGGGARAAARRWRGGWKPRACWCRWEARSPTGRQAMRS